MGNKIISISNHHHLNSETPQLTALAKALFNALLILELPSVSYLEKEASIGIVRVLGPVDKLLLIGTCTNASAVV